jgi:DNA-binding response OmpR family regulator
MTKRVLIVDDEPMVVGVLREFFASFEHGHAYEITTVSSAADAFILLLRERFDLILLDVVLPVIDHWHVQHAAGLNLLKRVRGLGVTAPVLMMTGGSGGTRREAEALIEGATGYLHKPFELHELDYLVALALGGSGPP